MIRQTCLLVILAALLVSAPAFAASPLNGAVEVRMGFYQPSFEEKGLTGTNPYETIFGDKSMFLFGMEGDFQFWQGFGSLGGFGTLSYGRVSGKGLLADGSKSADATRFTMLPLSAGLVYRFDVLAKRFNVPLVPVFKGGLVYSFWWITDGNGDTATWTDDRGDSDPSNDKKRSATGGTYGYTGSVGLHLLLDIFEPHTSVTFDNEMGVNNSYAFVELQAVELSDFGSKHSFDLSDLNVMFGLSFEL
jgi:hypothetical protein